MRLPALAAALAVVALVTGCVPQSPAPVPSPAEPSYTPLFASDEEALAAAEKAYREYNAISNLILNEGGKDPERIAPFVTEEYLGVALEEIAHIASEGWHTSGSTAVVSISLQQWFSETDGTATVVVYACIDVSGARLLDGNGNDVTPDREDQGLLQVSFRAQGPPPASLLLSGSELWQRSC